MRNALIVIVLIVLGGCSGMPKEAGPAHIPGHGRYMSAMNTFFVESTFLDILDPESPQGGRIRAIYNAGAYSGECAGLKPADGPWLSMRLNMVNGDPVWIINLEQISVPGEKSVYVHVLDITADLYVRGITPATLFSVVRSIDFQMGGDNCQLIKGLKPGDAFPDPVHPAAHTLKGAPQYETNGASDRFPPRASKSLLGSCTNGHDCPACTSLDGSVTAPNACCNNPNECRCDRGTLQNPFPRQSCN